ncbi:hypothetical protein NPX13_g8191 [Xylaria arbuscula]|uniref:mRNA 3'-end-processing protein RNA14 n=1 Tax=Xylaria arbuscula TaxID=114810 RepID=A0A9W8N978_9PEZI|nr:hypothetical protein NPX13_g8191 [Xylaria arbuscula]
MASETMDTTGDQINGTAAWEDAGLSGNTESNDQEIEAGDEEGEEGPDVDQAGPASDGDEDTADMDEEYDPESVEISTTAYNPESYNPESVPTPVLPDEEEPRASAPPVRSKPKTAGGFIVGSSDDEDDEPTPPPQNHLNNAAQPTVQPRAFSNSPLQKTKSAQDITPHVNESGVSATSTIDRPGNSNANAKSRLPTDVVGLLEDRVKEDPRGDIEAWFALIEEQKRRHRIEETRNTYERFLKIFPKAAEVWVAYIELEMSLDNFTQAEGILQRVLVAMPHVQLWTAYLNYVRRMNDLNDPSGVARQTVNAAYEFVLDNIGQDRDASTIWQDYIAFIKSGPGQLGGTGWQDQQKMDLLRKAYQRAICIPMANLNIFWKEYDQFELGLNKMTRKHGFREYHPWIQEDNRSPFTPRAGFEGDQEFLEQVKLWKAWIAWEKDDPLVLRSEDMASYQQRILHVYKHALMALWFWPEMWVDAAEWCFENKITNKEGNDVGLAFLVEGAAANPESVLIALKHADHIELTQRVGEDVQALTALAQAVRAPYDKVLDTLYEMIKKLKEKEASAITRINEDTTESDVNEASGGDDEDDEGEIKEPSTSIISKQDRIKAVQDGFAVQIQMLSQQISYLWIALARAFRRFQGQGKSSPPTGLRGIFTEARSKGRLTSEVYIAIAHVEWDVYQDVVATKIFERGSRLFPDSEHFFVEYLKHLHARRDFTNARVVFSQTVKRFKEKPELTHKLKPLYAYFHAYEARYGELAQVQELEKQMAELFPDESNMTPFAARFATERFNPITSRVIISPAQQMRPKAAILQSVEDVPLSTRATPQPAALLERSPRPQLLSANPINVNSPKRPFQADEADDYNPPRKMVRGVSPLKGAAGRRLDQQRRQGGTASSGGTISIPRDITFLLGLIPAADMSVPRFRTERLVQIIRETDIPTYADYRAQTEQASRAHTRPASNEYAPYQYSGRDSPGVTGRPASPYGGAARSVAQASTTYRNSPLRPGSSGSYEPPPVTYQAPGPSPFNPAVQHSQGAHSNPYAGWPANYAELAAQFSAAHSAHSAQPQSYQGSYY